LSVKRRQALYKTNGRAHLKEVNSSKGPERRLDRSANTVGRTGIKDRQEGKGGTHREQVGNYTLQPEKTSNPTRKTIR
jgi:hypothetical protein